MPRKKKKVRLKVKPEDSAAVGVTDRGVMVAWARRLGDPFVGPTVQHYGDTIYARDGNILLASWAETDDGEAIIFLEASFENKEKAALVDKVHDSILAAKKKFLIVSNAAANTDAEHKENVSSMINHHNRIEREGSKTTVESDDFKLLKQMINFYLSGFLPEFNEKMEACARQLVKMRARGTDTDSTPAS